jgi:hypothetical protein
MFRKPFKVDEDIQLNNAFNKWRDIQRYNGLRNRVSNRIANNIEFGINNVVDNVFKSIFNPKPSTPSPAPTDSPLPDDSHLLKNLPDAKQCEHIGNMGELFIVKELERIFDDSNILQNLYVKSDNNKYTEVDIVVVTKMGLFVIESKNYSGSISGKINDSYWIQTLHTNQRYKLFNPIIQNNWHVKSLKANLHTFPGLRFFSIIVFSDRCELNDVPVRSNGTIVIQRQNLLKHIFNIISDIKSVLYTDEIESIIKTLTPLSNPCNVVKEQHRNQLNKNNCKAADYA